VWPVIAAIWASVQSTSASRVTAVPRRSLNVTPLMPAAICALRHYARKPSDVHGLPSMVVRMIVDRFGVAPSIALSGAPTLKLTRAPVFDCRSRIRLPS
jgi:hypothetical protein